MKEIIYSGLLAALSTACVARSLPVGELEDEGSGETGVPETELPTTLGTDGGAMTPSGDTTDTSTGGESTEAEPNPQPEVCEGLDVDEGDEIPPECEGSYVWAWTGNECQQLCECIGPDCAQADPSLDDCLAPRLSCPVFTESCPMQEGTAAIEGSNPLTVGTFGRSDDNLVVGFGPSVLDLAGWSHSIFAEYHPWGGAGFIVYLPVPKGPGVFPITGAPLDDNFSLPWTGTLTITELTMEGPPETWTMSGSLFATDESGTETFTGEFMGINGCLELT